MDKPTLVFMWEVGGSHCPIYIIIFDSRQVFLRVYLSILLVTTSRPSSSVPHVSSCRLQTSHPLHSSYLFPMRSPVSYGVPISNIALGPDGYEHVYQKDKDNVTVATVQEVHRSISESPGSGTYSIKMAMRLDETNSTFISNIVIYRSVVLMYLLKAPNGWKPLTMRWPILGLTTVTTGLLIVLLELLCRISARYHGLAFAATIDDFSIWQTFCTQYLPTVISVCFNMIWSWIDLDVKRLEPWFQMSKPQGATAEDSLLLHYAFDFLAFVPLRAARRRWVSPLLLLK